MTRAAENLLFAAVSARLSTMSTKEIVTELLERLPENASQQDIARELELVAEVREGFAQLDRGEGVPIEEVERLLPTWIKAHTE